LALPSGVTSVFSPSARCTCCPDTFCCCICQLSGLLKISIQQHHIKQLLQWLMLLIPAANVTALAATLDISYAYVRESCLSLQC